MKYFSLYENIITFERTCQVFSQITYHKRSKLKTPWY